MSKLKEFEFYIPFWPFQVVLTSLFIVLKWTEQIDWSWGMVFCPVWLPCAVYFTFVMSICIVYFGILGLSLVTDPYFRKNWISHCRKNSKNSEENDLQNKN